MKPVTLAERLDVLFRDWGYRYNNGILIEKGIKGFSRDSIVAKFSSPLSAAEYLIPRIRDDNYYNQLQKILRINEKQ